MPTDDDRVIQSTVPKAAPPDASFDERLRVVESMCSHAIAEQRRQADVSRGTLEKMAQLEGVVLRIDSVVLTLAARDANRDRETAPPTIEQLQILRARYDEQARRLEAIEAARRVRGAKVNAKLDAVEQRLDRVERKEDGADDTAKRAAMNSDVALAKLAEANAKLVEGHEKKQEAKDGRRFEVVKLVLVPVLALLVGYGSAKLESCTGLRPNPAPSAPAPHP